MQKTPRSNRLQIAILGRRNAGKSSLINALTNQDIALVSHVPGTTADPVYKAMEIPPIGPVTLIDTAGIDDIGELGLLRAGKTWRVLEKVDLAVLVIDASSGIGAPERSVMERLCEMDTRDNSAIRDASNAGNCGKSGKTGGVPVVVVANKIDLAPFAPVREWEDTLGTEITKVSSVTGDGIEAVKERIIACAPTDWEGPSLTGELVSPGDIVILVTPLDIEAPKGRLILPQAQTIRDLLDNNARVMVVKEDAVGKSIEELKALPSLVITDSQVFGAVSKQVPSDVRLTSFSIIFARHKGDLATLAEGARHVSNLKPGAKVLIAEACTHHPVGDDIGRVKIPGWLEKHVGGHLNFSWTSGTGFPSDLEDFDLVVHCGGCMVTRREMLRRIARVRQAGVPIVNYGVLIAYLHGIMERALEAFEEAGIS
ncbi:MAG TPA: [FeFe] hydrogenase H-cluster maturation GTPase HydF [Firmicutes bacterium]|nr:[FeFe] hydrogenase H-cluster maturation GTPase HydF [Bacillota bacterium]